MKKILTICLLLLSILPFYGCSNIIQSVQSNETQQLLVKTTIQLATASYLDNNSSEGSLNILIDTTNKVIEFLQSEDIYESTIVDLQDKMHTLISNLELTVAKKVTLTSLSDVILSEGIKYAKMSVTDKLNDEYIQVLIFCAKTMKDTALLYKNSDIKNRSYSVTGK